MITVNSNDLLETDLKELSQLDLEKLLVYVGYEFKRRGWTAEDFDDEVRSSIDFETEE